MAVLSLPQSHHVGSFGDPQSHPALGIPHKVEVQERGVPFVSVNPHKVGAVVWVTAMGVPVRQTILISTTCLCIQVSSYQGTY